MPQHIRDLDQTSGMVISIETVQRRLHGAGLIAKRCKKITTDREKE